MLILEITSIKHKKNLVFTVLDFCDHIDYTCTKLPTHH